MGEAGAGVVAISHIGLCVADLGPTLFSLLVEDVDAVAERLCALGGTVLRPTRLAAKNGEFIYCLDPGGIRVELMRLAAGPDGAA